MPVTKAAEAYAKTLDGLDTLGWLQIDPSPNTGNVVESTHLPGERIVLDWLKNLFRKSDPKRRVPDMPPPEPPAYTPEAPPRPLAGKHLQQLKNIVEGRFHASPLRDDELIADLRAGGYLEMGDPPEPTKKGREVASRSSPWPVDGKID